MEFKNFKANVEIDSDFQAFYPIDFSRSESKDSSGMLLEQLEPKITCDRKTPKN